MTLSLTLTHQFHTMLTVDTHQAIPKWSIVHIIKRSIFPRIFTKNSKGSRHWPPNIYGILTTEKTLLLPRMLSYFTRKANILLVHKSHLKYRKLSIQHVWKDGRYKINALPTWVAGTVNNWRLPPPPISAELDKILSAPALWSFYSLWCPPPPPLQPPHLSDSIQCP
jgi:hypothetical protein